MAQQKKDNEGVWALIAFVIFVIALSVSWTMIPNRIGGVQNQESKNAFHTVESFLIESGQPYYYRGKADETFEESLAGVISGLQQHSVWGWSRPADGVLSNEFLKHLKGKAEAYNENEAIKQSLLRFIDAVDVLKEDRQINVVHGFEAASLAFANGIFVGWADDLAVKFLYDDSEATMEAALRSFRQAVLISELYFPITSMVFLMIGMVFSIGGLIAVWLARNANDMKHAFSLGFGAEVAEAVVFHIGYYYTTQKVSITQNEVFITIGVGVLMGCVAMKVYSDHRKKLMR